MAGTREALTLHLRQSKGVSPCSHQGGKLGSGPHCLAHTAFSRGSFRCVLPHGRERQAAHRCRAPAPHSIRKKQTEVCPATPSTRHPRDSVTRLLWSPEVKCGVCVRRPRTSNVQAKPAGPPARSPAPSAAPRAVPAVAVPPSPPGARGDSERLPRREILEAAIELR